MVGLAITRRGPKGVHRGESFGGLLGEGLEALSVGVEAEELDVWPDRSKRWKEKEWLHFVSYMIEVLRWHVSVWRLLWQINSLYCFYTDRNQKHPDNIVHYKSFLKKASISQLIFFHSSVLAQTWIVLPLKCHCMKYSIQHCKRSSELQINLKCFKINCMQ